MKLSFRVKIYTKFFLEAIEKFKKKVKSKPPNDSSIIILIRIDTLVFLFILFETILE